MNGPKRSNIKGGSECQFCCTSFQTKISYQRHMEKVHVKEVKCPNGITDSSLRPDDGAGLTQLTEDGNLKSASNVSKSSLTKQIKTSECVIQLHHVENSIINSNNNNHNINKNKNNNDTIPDLDDPSSSCSPSVIQIYSRENSREDEVCVKSEASEDDALFQHNTFSKLRASNGKCLGKDAYSARKFKCNICGWAFHQRGVLRRHMNVHSTFRKFCCVNCGARFKRKDDMDRHLRSQRCEKRIQRSQKTASNSPTSKVIKMEEEPIPVQEKKVELQVKVKQEVDQILDSSISNGDTSLLGEHMPCFRCDNCQFPFTHDYHLEIHLMNKVCANRKRPEPQVPVMKKNSNSKINQMKTRKNTNVLSAGSAISRKYKLRRKNESVIILRRDFKIELEDNEQYWCVECGKGFAKERTFNRHMRFAHSNHFVYPKYSCRNCGLSFKAEDDLSKHLNEKLCSTPKTFLRNSFDCLVKLNDIKQEPVFSEYTPSKGKYRLREKSVIEVLALDGNSTKNRRYECPVCSKSFRFAAAFKRHKRTFHPNSKPLKCGRKGNWRNNMQSKHSKVKIGMQEKYKCNVCSRVCDSISRLRRHQIVHSEARPHKCKVCGRAYKYKEDMKHHILHNHSLEEQCAATEVKTENEVLSTEAATKVENQVFCLTPTGEIL